MIFYIEKEHHHFPHCKLPKYIQYKIPTSNINDNIDFNNHHIQPSCHIKPTKLIKKLSSDTDNNLDEINSDFIKNETDNKYIYTTDLSINDKINNKINDKINNKINNKIKEVIYTNKEQIKIINEFLSNFLEKN
jgi:hypothetical protein